MSQKAKRIVHLCYGTVLTLLILASCVAFILLCIEIYKSGSRPFSRESIAAAFDRIDVLVYTALGAVVGGILLSIALPLERSRPKAMRDEYETLKRLRKRVGVAVPSREGQLRMTLRIGSATLAVLLGIWPFVRLCSASRYGLEDLNGDVIAGVLPVLLWVAITLVLAILCSLLCTASVRREIALCKAAIAEGRTASDTSSCENVLTSVRRSLKENERTSLLVIRAVILVVAVLFIVLGALNGGIDDVLGKAIRICTECIGLG